MPIKTSLIKTFLTLLLLIASSSPIFTQAGNSNTAKTPAQAAEQTVKTDETISFLLADNENARALIEKQEKRIADLEAENASERENSASIGKSYESAKSEIESLKRSNAALERAVAVNEQTIALLKSDNAKQRETAKKANKAKWKARAAVVVLTILEVVRIVN